MGINPMSCAQSCAQLIGLPEIICLLFIGSYAVILCKRESPGIECLLEFVKRIWSDAVPLPDLGLTEFCQWLDFFNPCLGQSPACRG